ncbi:MAG: biosynthetic-type acetolactate synthase large subunit [Kiritimatiellaeota bacterium]|nr:biosynthetic-type acetolactate synthase large subunit [Kiritimatiellota bacterium]
MADKEQKGAVAHNAAEPTTRSGARIVIEGLERAGCEIIFAYPGGWIIDVFNEITASEKIHLILPRHEQGGTHAADGYARATGRVGVCLVTSGPGATNTVTALATANMDGIPLVCITGQVSTKAIGNDAFQEVDICGVTRPITKHNFLVRNVDDLPRIMMEAFHIASSGKPGPVLIDIPKDVQLAKTAAPFPDEVDRAGYKPSFDGHPKTISRLAAMINSAKRPLIYAGGGVISANASDALVALSRKADIPVVTSLLGLGSFPETDTLSLGWVGMHGNSAANKAVRECDLLIAVGARFADRVTGKVSAFAPGAKIAHIDIDPSAIGKSVRCDLPLVGHIAPVLDELLPQVAAAEHAEWRALWAQWKVDFPFEYPASPSGYIMPQFVIEQIDAVGKGRAVVVTDVGQNQMFCAQFYKHTRPRNFLSSGGLGTMGFSVPAAIGAQLGRPEDLVVSVSGDGGFQMNAQELVVAVEHKLPVKFVILNNGFLGNVRQWQDLFFKRNLSATVLTQHSRPKNERIEAPPDAPYLPDFITLAKAHGARATRITKIADVAPALKEAFASPEPWVLEFIVEPYSNVMPMIPPGQTVEETMRTMPLFD